MKLNNGNQIDVRVPDCYGPKGYVFWVGDCFQPLTYFVRGESWEDAYEWLLADDRFVRLQTVDPIDMDDEMRRDIEAGTDMHGADWNDSGQLVWTEAVGGTSLANFAKNRS